jgi:hypothetical protein
MPAVRSVILVVRLAACAPLMGRGGARGDASGLADKAVASKERQATLFARPPAPSRLPPSH